MSELSEKPDDVVFFDSTNINESCNPDRRFTKEKPTLVVDTSSSKSLSFLSGAMQVVATIMLFLSIPLISEYDEPLHRFWGFVILGGSILIYIWRVFVKFLIPITKSLEYRNAQVEDKYNIKSK